LYKKQQEPKSEAAVLSTAQPWFFVCWIYGA